MFLAQTQITLYLHLSLPYTKAGQRWCGFLSWNHRLLPLRKNILCIVQQYVYRAGPIKTSESWMLDLNTCTYNRCASIQINRFCEKTYRFLMRESSAQFMKQQRVQKIQFKESVKQSAIHRSSEVFLKSRPHTLCPPPQTTMASYQIK